MPSELLCNECAVYFHYERDDTGHFVEGGLWIKGFNGPCPPDKGSFQCDTPALRLEANGTWAYGSFDNFIFDYRTNAGLFAAVSAAQGRDCSDPTATGGIALQSDELGLTLYRTGNTVRNALQGTADDYALGCDDQPCADGFTFDPNTGICVQIIGNIKPPPPPPPICPPGQAPDVNGVCRPLDPPVPRGVRNLTGPRAALNPTFQSAPTPFAMKDCGCGVDDDTEIEYDAGGNPAAQIAGLPANPNPRQVGIGIARLSSVGNRTRVLASPNPVSGGGARHGWRQPIGAPTPYSSS